MKKVIRVNRIFSTLIVSTTVQHSSRVVVERLCINLVSIITLVGQVRRMVIRILTKPYASTKNLLLKVTQKQ